jgi:uncharacterized protein
VLIGIAASVMLLFNGKVTGISGILGGIVNSHTSDKSWRVFFIGGLILGGLILKIVYPMSLNLESHALPMDYIVAGLLVGYGTLLGNGCTSGHGVCGISRFSLRSTMATITFIAFGIIGVVLFKTIRGEL